MVRVWLINPYGPLPGEGWRDYRFTYAARALAARGHDVTWWTAAFDHHTKRFRESSSRGSFSIALVPTPAYHRNVGLGRLRLHAKSKLVRRDPRFQHIVIGPILGIAKIEPLDQRQLAALPR